MELECKLNDIENSTSKKQCFFQFISLLIIVLSDDNTYYSSLYLNGVGKYLIQIFAVVLLICSTGVKKIAISKNSSLIFAVFFVGVLISVLINQDLSNMYSYTIIVYLLIALLFTSCISTFEFAKSYTNIMQCICIYSVVFTLFMYYVPSLQGIFPTFKHYSDSYYGGYITFINGFLSNIHLIGGGTVEFRNYGIYTEPGKFQFFIILSFLIDVFFLKRGKIGKRIVVYAIACILTFSPVGIILFAAVLLLALFKEKSNKKIMIPVGLLSLFIIFEMYFSSNLLFKEELSFSFMKLWDGGGSINARLGSFIGDFRSWIKRPLFGWGYTDFYISGAFFREFTKHNVNTILSIFAIWGVIPGVTFLSLIKRFVDRIDKRLLLRIVIFIVIVLSISNEYFVGSITMYCVFFALSNDGAVYTQKGVRS